MKIETHTTDRKALAKRISELLHQDAIYAGIPSCAYRIGAVTVDRGGAINTDDAETLETLKPFLIEQGYIDREPENESEAMPDMEAGAQTEAAPGMEAAPEPGPLPTTDTVLPHTSDIERMEISMPADGMPIAALKNLIYTLYSKQYLLNRATGSDVLSISDEVVARLKEYTPETPEAFSELLADFRALGDLDGFDFRDGNVTMAFPHDAEHPENWAVYGFLFDRIVKAALAADRVFPKKQQPENEKYYMRSWLIRLGLGGAEYKSLRSLMLRNLKGNTAFPDDAAAQKHREKYAELRRASREGQVEAE